MERILGIIPLLGGIYGILVGYRFIPMNRKDPEKNELWYKQFGTMTKILSPFIAIFGLLTIFGIV